VFRLHGSEKAGSIQRLLVRSDLDRVGKWDSVDLGIYLLSIELALAFMIVLYRERLLTPASETDFPFM
jgi:hypothetical protein